MKLNRLLLILGTASLSVLASCSTDNTDPIGGGDSVEALFTAGIQTRAKDGRWDGGDAVGITMIRDNAVYGDIFNYKYTTADGGSIFSPAAGQTVYFPSDGSTVSFRAYYPYISSLPQTLMYPVDVSSQSKLEDIDFMTADFSGAGYSKTNNVVDVKFYHRLTKLVFQLSKDSEIQTDLRDFTLTIEGMNTKGTYDIINDVLTDDASSNSAFTVPVDPALDPLRTAIVLPRPTAGAGVKFVFTNGTDSYEAPLPDDITLLSKTSYLLKINISKTEMKLTATIVDWTSGGDITLVSVAPGTNVSGGTNVTTGDKLTVYTGDNSTRTELTTYTYSGNGTGDGTWTPAAPVYWEDVNLPTSFYGLISGQQADPATNQLTDYIVADPIPVTTPAGLNFNLKHVASKVTVQIRSANSTYTASDFTITLPQYQTGGTMNNGVFVSGNTPADISIPVVSGSAVGFIQPQVRTQGSDIVKLVYTPSSGANAKTFELKYTSDVVFEAGKAYVIIIDIDKTPLTVSAKVIDWQQASDIQLIATGLTVNGTLDNTSEFFERKSIKVYKTLPDPFEERTYTYEPAATQTYWTWNTSTPLYWDEIDSTSDVDLTAVYYPLQDLIPTNITGSLPIAWSVLTDQSSGYADYDILKSHLSLSSPTYANFKFTHALSKVRVEISAPDFSTADITGMQVTLKNFLIDGGISLSDGSTLSGMTRADITPMTETADAVFTALVFPDQVAAGTTVLTVKLPNYSSPFNGTLTLPLSFEEGKQTTIKVTLRLTKMELSGTLEPWGDAGTGEIVIE